MDLSRRQAVVLPRRDVPGVRQPGAARHRDARDSQGRVRDEARRRRPTAGLPRREPSRSRGTQSQGRGRARNLREVCRPGSAQSPDEDFPGDALLDGRAVGRLPSADQRAGPVRGGRVRVSISRRQPARRQLAALVHARRKYRRAGDDRLRQVAQERGQLDDFRSGAEAAARIVRQNFQDETVPRMRSRCGASSATS